MSKKINKSKLLPPPNMVKVGYKQYSVKEENKEWGDKHQAVAEIDSENSTIHYVGDHGCQLELTNSILHEIMHSIVQINHIKLPDEAQEEHVVDSMANGLTTILVDNPDLLKWMVEGLTNTSEEDKDE